MLHARTKEEQSSNPPASTTPEGSIGKKDSDSHMSNTFYDSLDSPFLPAKYLTQDTSTYHQHQSPSPGVEVDAPSHSNNSATLTNANGLHHGNERPSRLQKGFLPPSHHSDSHRSGSASSSKSGKDVAGEQDGQEESDSGTPLEQLIELGASGHLGGGGGDIDDGGEQSQSDTLSDLSDVLPSDDGSDHSGSQRMRLEQSPDSFHLQEAKRNLKRAEELGYSIRNRGGGYSIRNGGGGDSHSGRISHNSLNGRKDRDEEGAQVPVGTTAPTVTTNGGKNILPSQLSRKASQIPRPTYSSRSTSSSPHQQQVLLNSSAKDHSHMTFPGEADSGFAGSELPSRTATRMDAVSPVGGRRYRNNLASSVLQSTASEDELNQQKFVEAT